VAKDNFGFGEEDGFEYVETDKVIAKANGTVSEEKFDF
jgi:hypothetical protein